ncbi:MAG: hypothetical protein EBT86_07115 [Actinobacteria bacterium]|nr:hypothetical protein [Actinomycetota bacterium]
MSAQPSWPLSCEPNQFLPKFITRSRREVASRDSVNANQYQHWQTDGKYGIYGRRDLNAQAPVLDTAPISSRFVERNYRSAPRLENDQGGLGMNPYFNKYDVAYDGTNAVRELRAAVYEDKNMESLRESKRLLERNLDNRWLMDGEAARMSALERMERLRPKQDDIRVVYH